MTKNNRILTIVFTLVFGVLAMLFGAKDLVNSIQLSKRGRSVVAEIVDGWDHVSGLTRSHSYTLVVSFQSEKGNAVRKELRVSEEVYIASQGTRTVMVFYLPEDPEICAAGEKVEIRYGGLVFGIFLVGLAAYVSWFYSPSGRIKKHLKKLMQERHEYVPA